MASRIFLRRIVVMLCFLLGVRGVFAQNARVSGLVSDAQKASVPSAVIEVVDQNTQVKTTAKSNGSGLYSIPSLPPGRYRISVSAPGFETQIIENVNLAVASKVSLDIVLHPGNVTQTVMVNGDSLEINTTDASVSTVVDRKFVENMPLNGRSFQSLLTVIPGVAVVPSSGVGASGEITVNGQRTEANYFTVDGVAANTGNSPTANGVAAGYSGGTPGESTLGTTQTMVSVEALQEFRATTSTYAAQYGRTPGGQFEFSTRAGENQWHGALFEYFRNDALDANRWFNKYLGQPRTQERQNDFGGTLGGPIRLPYLYNGADKSFFFFSYEGLQLHAPQPTVAASVPDMWLRTSPDVPQAIRAMLNAFPLPDDRSESSQGTELVNSTVPYSNPSSLNAFSIRLDHSVNDRFKIFARLATNPNKTDSRATTDLAVNNSSKANVKVLTLGSTNFFTSNFTNELRFNLTANDIDYRTTSDNFHGATPYSLDGLPGLGNSSFFIFNLDWGASPYPTLRFAPISTKQRQINIVDWMSASIGRHSLRWGIDYRKLRNSEFLPPLCEYGYFYSPLQVISGVPKMIYTYKFSANAKPYYENFSAYLQDEWKMSSRLSLSLGVRWDINPAPYDANGNNPYTITTTDLKTVDIAPSGTPLWHTTWANLAPRFGLAYQAHTTPGHETVVRMGAGLFYDTGSSMGSFGYNASGVFSASVLAGQQFPLTQTVVDSLPAPGVTKPYNTSFMGFDPHLVLPRTGEWNLSLEQGLGTNQTLTIGYVASVGRKLIREGYYYPSRVGNPNFTAAASLTMVSNGADSSYNALQVSWQRRLTRGLQTQTSYTWSHSIDNSSTNFQTYSLLRADSNFDIRHNFQAAITYELPGSFSNRLLSEVLNHWSIDSRISARSGLPVDVVGSYTVDPVTGNYLLIHPDRVAGQPLYLSTPDTSGARVPGGRRINCAAFSIAGTSACGLATIPATATEGNAGRNIARGFDAVQADMALRKEFPIHEQLNLQLRAEAFNILNHPVFGSIYSMITNGPGRFGYAYTTLDSQLGGLNSLYQMGGPRSLQLALRLHF